MKREALASKLYYEESPPTHTPVQHEKTRSKWQQIARMIAYAILTGVVVVIGYLCLCAKTVEEQYAVDHYQAILPALREQNANLEVQVKALNSLNRIDRIARTELHMGYPAERLVIVEEPEAVANQSKPAAFYAWRSRKTIALP